MPRGRPERWLLVSTYDLGRQPVALAALAARLRAVDAEVHVVDLSVDPLEVAAGEPGRFDRVAWSLPMHTAMRLALDSMAAVSAAHPQLRQAAFGLYAELNEPMLGSMGVEVLRGTSTPAPLDRRGLPGLARYARLIMPDGTARVVGATEASIGCRHRCRHCPVVPVFAGRFRPVPVADVLRDVAVLVDAGAQHITFADPDFLNGPAHGLRVATALHERFPQLSFDITAKVEHLLTHQRLLEPLRQAGCVLITSALESFDDAVLRHLGKGHTARDAARVVAVCRAAGIGLNPTFVPFTPWSTVAGYRRLLDEVETLELIEAVHPVQYGIRLLVSARSGLLELADVASLVGPFDPVALAHPWAHPDPAVDALQRDVMALVRAPAGTGDDGDGEDGDRDGDGDGDGGHGPAGRRALHRALRRLCEPGLCAEPEPGGALQPAAIPWFTEPWFC